MAEAAEFTPTTLLWIALILVAARAASLIRRFGQPEVLGQLLAGVVLGNLGLVGFHGLDAMLHDPAIGFLASLGVVILLFQIGMESDATAIGRVGIPAAAVACIGVAVPFALGAYLVGPLLFPTAEPIAHLFLGAALTATSVGVTAAVFREFGLQATREARIILGAAVIDDVLGLVILAVVSAIATIGTVTAADIGFVVLKAATFLVGGLVIGQLAAPLLGRLFSTISTGLGMKFTLAMSFCLTFAFLAHWAGLAPIVGAFAAGLVLDPVHFRHFRDSSLACDIRDALADADVSVTSKLAPVLDKHADRHVEDLLEPVGHFLVPIFFVMAGAALKLEALANVTVLLVALATTAVAIAGKVVAGIAAGKSSRLLVGLGMVPRGEVGLVFAVVGRSLGAVSDELFSVIVIMVVFTTLLTPPAIAWILRRRRRTGGGESTTGESESSGPSGSAASAGGQRDTR